MKRKTYLAWAAALLYTCLIFAMSLMPGSDSSGLSEKIALFVMNLLHGLPFTFEQIHHFIRKLAHFSEYYALALLVQNAARGSLSTKKAMLCIVLYGMIAPAIDETIQLFVPGRAGALMDVMIDMSGYFAAWATVSLINARISDHHG